MDFDRVLTVPLTPGRQHSLSVQSPFVVPAAAMNRINTTLLVDLTTMNRPQEQQRPQRAFQN